MGKHFIFMIRYVYAFYTVHEVLTASILGWFAIPSPGLLWLGSWLEVSWKGAPGDWT